VMPLMCACKLMRGAVGALASNSISGA